MEDDGSIVRWLAPPGQGLSWITWSSLDADTADAAIAAQRDYFAARGEGVEWKLYDYDQPADLAARLVAAGFVPDDEELMLVADTAAIVADVALPDGVRLVPVTDEAGVHALMAVHRHEPGSEEMSWLTASLLETLGDERRAHRDGRGDGGDEPVSSARIEFVPGTDFAGLWGGSTVPQWRGKGIFRALVAYRAGRAAARGYRYLQVDASQMSRPILKRLGFTPVASTTPYVWKPSGVLTRCCGVVELKTPAEIEAMRAAGRVVATALQEVRKHADVGVSLIELDEVARSVLAENGATSPFLGYQPSFAHAPFPAVICASVNDAALHGIPGPYRLVDGDLVSIDFGATLNGWTGDSAISFAVGTPRKADIRLDLDRGARAGCRDRRGRARRAARRRLRGHRLGSQGGRLRPAHRFRRSRGRTNHARVAFGAQRRQGGPRPEARGWPCDRDRTLVHGRRSRYLPRRSGRLDAPQRGWQQGRARRAHRRRDRVRPGDPDGALTAGNSVAAVSGRQHHELMTERGPLAPAAEGMRLPFSAIPAALRAEVERQLGGRVVDAVTQPGGFSPGVAARVRLADGRRAFVKAVGDINPESPGIHRAEARIAAVLPASAPAARLLGAIDDSGWVILILEDIDGQLPAQPWRPDELERVLAALADQAVALTPAPIDAPPAASRFSHPGRSWGLLAAAARSGADDLSGLDPWVLAHLDELAALERGWGDAVRGDTLVHGDVRADNILLTPDRVVFVDWPWACLAPPWFDLVAMLPNVALNGGPAPEDLFSAHVLARDAEPWAVTTAVGALAGMWAYLGRQPDPPGLPTLRAFQQAHGAAAVDWLKVRLAAG